MALVSFCVCTVWFVSDLVDTTKTGFLASRLTILKAYLFDHNTFINSTSVFCTIYTYIKYQQYKNHITQQFIRQHIPARKIFLFKPCSSLSLCHMVAIKNLPVHRFSVVIIPFLVLWNSSIHNVFIHVNPTYGQLFEINDVVS